MNQDILLSKIVANTTETTWSQAYTTLNVYIALSIEKKEGKSSVTSAGKDLLEKLQREFFALDDKNLENIKKAVENVTTTIEKDISYSILVGAIVKDILYLVLASNGVVVIKRNGKVGTIAKGVENEITGFSGKLSHDDIIILETGDFAEKIPLATLQDYLADSNILTISENITPLIHDNSKGTEAAIILQYKDLTQPDSVSEKPLAVVVPDENDEIVLHESHEGKLEELGDEEQEYLSEKRKGFAFPKISLPSMQLSKIKLPGGKKAAIGAAILILLFVLAGSIVMQKMTQQNKAREAAFATVYDPAQKKFDEAVSLLTLNKSIALDELAALQKSLKDDIGKFPTASNEYKKLQDLLTKVNSKIDETGGGSGVKNQKTLLKASDLKDFKSITAITFKGGELSVLDGDSKRAATITTEGKLKKSFDTDKTTGKYITADKAFIYALGDSIAQIDKGTTKSTTIVKSAKGSSIDLFGSNIYILSEKDVEKYRAPAYEKASYFTDTPSFSSTPVSMTIGGPVYVLEQSGKIQKFSKGKVEGFDIKGLLSPIGDAGQIYTDTDYANIYILDGSHERLVVISTSGDFVTQYEWNEFKDANSFSIDESGKKGYLLKNNTVFTFDL